MRLSRVVPLVAAGALAAACNGTDPSNAAPAAAFSAECSQLECTFENGSTDEDGTLAAYAWDFGDGETGAGEDAAHAYAAPGGQFTVTLRVTDDDGAAATAVRQVSVSVANAAPLAEFAVSCVNLTCSFTDGSTDPDAGGAVASHTWDFGDGQGSSEQNPVHTYVFPGGRFTVSLSITDDDGAPATAAKEVDAVMGSGPDRSGTYERLTPHTAVGRHSRYVIRADGTFELQDGTGSDMETYSGRWESACCWGGWAIEPGSYILFEFDDFPEDTWCGGEGFGAFMLDGQMGVSYCSAPISAGLEEGVYTSGPTTGPPAIPPPHPGQIAFVRHGRIHRSNTDGSGVLQLSNGPDDHSPAWSPNGSRIAFNRVIGGTTGIFVMDADGSNMVQRTTAGGGATWSPDGEWIAFVCAEGLCKVRADEDGTEPVVLFNQGGGVTDDPAWSPDGARIAFVSDWNLFDVWFDIWVVDPDGSGSTALTHHTPATPNPDTQWQPAWSPDSRRIALVECPWAFVTCSSSVIAVMNADGSGRVRLVAASGSANPTWSPDGQVIAFASFNDIEWVSVDGSQRGRIIGNGHSPAWRP